jgi:hypothetical protein
VAGIPRWREKATVTLAAILPRIFRLAYRADTPDSKGQRHAGQIQPFGEPQAALGRDLDQLWIVPDGPAANKSSGSRAAGEMTGSCSFS